MLIVIVLNTKLITTKCIIYCVLAIEEFTGKPQMKTMYEY